MKNMEIQKKATMKINNIKQLLAATICVMAFAACSSDEVQTGKALKDADTILTWVKDAIAKVPEEET